MFITLTVLISTNAHVVTADVYNFLLLLPIPFTLCPQQASHLVMVPCLLQ